MARGLLAHNPGLVFAAPYLWRYEMANIITINHRRGRIPAHNVANSITFLRDMRVSLMPPPPLARCVEVAGAHGLTGYDAAYLALALDEGAPLLTFDAALAAAAQRAGLDGVDALAP